MDSPTQKQPFSTRAILEALTFPLMIVGAESRIVYANHSTEQFFGSGVRRLLRSTLADWVPPGSPLLTVVEQVRQQGAAIVEHDLDLSTPKIGNHTVSINATPVQENGESAVLLCIFESSVARTLDRQLNHRGAVRTVVGMADILAHEVKNPLSGIRGAAQLLEQNANDEDRMLTQLICDETDRVCALVTRMESFSDKPLERDAFNIHEALERARRIAEAGFAANISFIEQYDPSLPPVHGHFDQMVQVFLNLIKNAAEAAPTGQGEIRLLTAYRHGIRMTVPGTGERTNLPIEASVIDNGEGIPLELRGHLFDPFVTSKRSGTGLGLALVAKIVGDHGGVVDCVSEPRRTQFRVMLPVSEEAQVRARAS